MDIQGKIDAIVSRVKSNPDFSSKFASNPVQAVESIFGTYLPDDQINVVIDGVKAKISMERVSGAFSSMKKLF